MEFHENPAHAQTVDTRPFFFLPRAKRAARLPAREKRGTGDEANEHILTHDNHIHVLLYGEEFCCVHMRILTIFIHVHAMLMVT